MIKTIHNYFNHSYYAYLNGSFALAVSIIPLYFGHQNQDLGLVLSGALLCGMGTFLLICKIIVDVKRYELTKKFYQKAQNHKVENQDVEDIPVDKNIVKKIVRILNCQKETRIQDIVDQCKEYPIKTIATKKNKEGTSYEERTLQSFITQEKPNITLEDIERLGWETFAQRD